MTEPVSSKSFPVCTREDLRKIAVPDDVNGDGHLDRVLVDPETYRVSVSLGGKSNRYSPWVSRFVPEDRRFAPFKFWGYSFDAIFSAPFNPYVVYFFKSALPDESEASKLALDGIREMSYQIAAEPGLSSCQLGLRVLGSSAGKEVNFFVPVPYRPLLNPYVPEGQDPYVRIRRRDPKAKRPRDLDMRNPYR
jgi:hypothetical protein